MNILWNLFITIGIFTKLLFGIQAPGTLTLKISYRMDSRTENPGPAELHSTIRTGGIILYNNKNQMRSNENDKQRLETAISFEVNNISALLSYTGRLQISWNNKMGNSIIIEFIEPSFHFRIKNSDTQKKIPMSFYSRDLEKELDVLITAKCRRNFYPKFQCTVMCIESENTQHCNSEGKKICRKGYFYHKQFQTCETDWCWNAALSCQNKGHCINKKNEFVCVCSSLYTGKHCEKYVDLCANFICTNGTTCAIKNQKIVCLENISQKSKYNSNGFSFQSISIRTFVAIIVFLIVMIFTTAITIWACQNSKKRKARSTETSLHSGHSYYPYASFHKISDSCLYCNQNLSRCLCLRNNYIANKHYYSLKSPGNRIIGSLNRAHSDILISNYDKQLSVSTLAHIDETFPLPPPAQYEDTGDIFML